MTCRAIRGEDKLGQWIICGAKAVHLDSSRHAAAPLCQAHHELHKAGHVVAVAIQDDRVELWRWD